MASHKVNICSINAAAIAQASVSAGIRSAVERQFSFLSSMGYGFRVRQDRRMRLSRKHPEPTQTRTQNHPEDGRSDN